jgi:hypothetical protein
MGNILDSYETNDYDNMMSSYSGYGQDFYSGLSYA